MKKILYLCGVLLMLTGVLTGCSGDLYSDSELTQLHDIVNFVEKQQTEFINVVQDSLTSLIGKGLPNDYDLVDFLSTRDIDPNKPMVALTYDDGPSSTSTERIVSLLEQYNARATFFVVGERLGEGTAAVVQHAVDIGCEIANHTTDHSWLTSLDLDTMNAKINDNADLIYQYSGQKSRLLRPPGGLVNEQLEENAEDPLIMWTVDTRDWESRDPSQIIPIAENYVNDGSIILMHDIYDTTADASETIIPWLIENGYQLVTVSELAYLKGIDLQAGVSYYNLRPEDNPDSVKQ